MFNLVSEIKITQKASEAFPTRDQTFTFNFVNDCEVNSSWKNLTDTARLIFPKNIAFIDKEGNKFSWAGKDLTGNTDRNTTPILLRGDAINIRLGYFYKSPAGYVTVMNDIFSGYISSINNRIPIEIECEDNMWLLKQVQCPNKVFSSTQTIQEIISYLLSTSSKTSSFTVKGGIGSSSNVKTSVGEFRTMNETIAQVLDRIRRDYKLECYFRGNELSVSGIVYYPEFSTDPIVFNFQQNIISDSLEYRRLDDIKLGIKAYSVDKKELQTKNSKGQFKTKNTRIETFVGDTDGEVRTLYFWNVKTIAELKKMAQERLTRFFYEGYFGKFTTFGLPFITHGNAVRLVDAIIPERDGTYLVKGVTYRFGLDGFRQEIELDTRIDGVYTQEQLNNGI